MVLVKASPTIAGDGDPPQLATTPVSNDKLAERQGKINAWTNHESLFGKTRSKTHPLEPVPWKFKYHYRCIEANRQGHKQSIIDWELTASWMRVSDDRERQTKIRQKFENELWASNRDTVLFVGNMHHYHRVF